MKPENKNKPEYKQKMSIIFILLHNIEYFEYTYSRLKCNFIFYF